MRDAKKTKEKKSYRFRTLRWRLTFFVFFIMLAAGTLTMGAFLLVNIAFGFSPLVFALTFNPYFFLLIMLGICTLIATVLVNGFGHYYLRPLNRLIAATKEVTRGNFKVQVKKEKRKKGKIYVKPPSEMGALEDSFNEMVRELDGIEIFRNDFINNFSHEFKTPIVSIRGFARELQQEIREERAAGALILSKTNDGGGYFLPSEGEQGKAEIQAFISTLHARAANTFAALKAAKAALKER